MGKKESTLPSAKEEKLTFENSFPGTGEMVMTEILFSNKAQFTIKQVILPCSKQDDVAVRTISDPGITIIPSFLSYDFESMVVNKILSHGIEQKVIFEILITEYGKVVVRRIDYPKSGEKVIITIVHPETPVEVRTNVLFSPDGIIETKRIYFSSSGNEVI